MCKGGTNLSIDFGDLETQSKMIDAEQGSKNQNVNNNENVCLFFTIRRGLFYIEKARKLFFFLKKNMKYLLSLTYPNMIYSYDIVYSDMF